jgi:hypothetical protein
MFHAPDHNHIKDHKTKYKYILDYNIKKTSYLYNNVLGAIFSKFEKMAPKTLLYKYDVFYISFMGLIFLFLLFYGL